ncbi:septum formation initiator family protein [Spirochaetota bacterium]
MNKKDRIRIIILAFFLAGVYVFVFSDSGILKRIELERDINTLQKKIDNLKNDKVKLEKMYEKYRGGGQSKKDALKSGFISKDGKLVFFKGINQKRKREKGKSLESNSRFSFIKLKHLQVVWIVFSTLVLLFYLSMIYKKKNE